MSFSEGWAEKTATLRSSGDIITSRSNVISIPTYEYLIRLSRHFETNAGIRFFFLVVPSMESVPMDSYLINAIREKGIDPAGKTVFFLVSCRERSAGLWTGRILEGLINERDRNGIIAGKMRHALAHGDFSRALLTGTRSVASLLAEKTGVDMSAFPDIRSRTGKHATKKDPSSGMRIERKAINAAGIIFLSLLVVLFFSLLSRFFLRPLNPPSRKAPGFGKGRNGKGF
jgi:uncharacterized membrane protein YgcG